MVCCLHSTLKVKTIPRERNRSFTGGHYYKSTTGHESATILVYVCYTKFYGLYFSSNSFKGVVSVVSCTNILILNNLYRL